MVTFPKTGRRLDWILVSPQLEFADHRILDDPISDHYAVVAEIRKKNETDKPSRQQEHPL
jgi:endonuclease/exonuclease/phosphatase family metal-dependent hydrolase